MKHKPAIFFLAMIFIVYSCGNSTSSDNNFYNYSINHQVKGLKSAVVSAHPLASQAGAWVMSQGGNAFDAAIATQLALAVVYPAAGNLGGGGFMISRGFDGKLMMLDFREKAPLKATKKMYLDKDGNVIKEKRESALATGIPGTIDGIFQIVPYAKLSIAKLFEPSIALAKYGFSISEREADGLNKYQDLFRKYNKDDCPFIKGRWTSGDTLKQTKLAMTLKRIAERGRDEFYTGETADLIVEQSAKSKGIISKKDLKKYASVWRTPITFSYKDYDIIVPNLPSSGGIILAQLFTMIEPYTEQGIFKKTNINAIQTMIEVERRAYADRAKYMGDPDYYNAPLDAMLDKRYVQSKIQTFKPGQSAVSSRTLALPKLPQNTSEETTHISIVDREGNAVSITTTLNGAYGSKVYVSGAGFLLNNEMDDFSAKAGTPNMYGAVEGEPNIIEPEKRMLSSMTPTIVLRKGKLRYVVGSPGGTTIPTSVFQVLINLIEYHLSEKEAVFNPRFHHQYLPDSVILESSFPTAYQDSLINLGYEIYARPSIGRVGLIAIEDDYTLTAVGDNRGDNSPDGEK